MTLLTIAAIAGNRFRKERGPSALADEYLSRAERFNQRLNAYIDIDRYGAMEQARQLEGDAGTPGPLYGVPLGIKDLVDIAGQITSAASNVLREHRAAHDAEVIGRIRGAGAIFLGKTNLHEFAYGGSGVISSFGPARNPWDTSRITGGSSSGSAAAVAAGMCMAAIGTDTAGSIRLPASFCGIVGFKPSYGRVSRNGVVPLAESYDHVGPMTLTVEDARILFEVLTGSATPRAVSSAKLRIGVPESYFYRELEGEVGKILSSALGEIERAGHRLMTVDFPFDEDRTLASFESYRYHEKWVEESPELYQPETLRRIKTGAKVTNEAAEEARAKLKKIRNEAGDIFKDIDVLITPTVPVLPPAIDDLLGNPETLRHRELTMLRNTRPFNVLGVPAISVPWELSREGLPVGIQLAAAPGRDFELLAMAESFERLAPWQGRTPPGF